MAIVRWDPFRELVNVQDQVNRLFSDAYGRRGDDDLMQQGTWMPPVDIYEDGNQELVLRAELPDMTREDIEITVEDNTLTLHGEKKQDPSVRQEQFHRVERSYGTFSRSFALPPTIDGSKVRAEYKNGVLTVRLPLREEAKPKQIHVQVTG